MQLPPSEKRWAIVVGVNHYQDGMDLTFAVADAKEFAEVLTKRLAIPRSNITVLTSGEPDLYLRPTKEQILDHLRRLGRKMQDGSLLVFAFSGHGFDATCLDENRRTCFEEFLAPADAVASSKRETSLSATELAAAMRSSKAKEILTFLDVCRTEGSLSWAPMLADHHTLSFDLSPEGVVAFATFNATASNEAAYEDNARRHSYYASALIEGLERSTEARNCRGEVTLDSLDQYLSATVTRRVELHEKSGEHPWAQIRGFDPHRLVLVAPPAEPCPNGARLNSEDGLCYSWVPEGHVHIGCPARQCGPLDQEWRAFTQTNGFFLTQTEVTVGAYRKYSTKYHHSMPELTYVNPEWEDAEKPVVNLKWEEANSYCHQIGGRLPTEDEWEYAARAGTNETSYYWGDHAEQKLANFGRSPGTASLVRNKTFPPNKFGLYEMLGNAAEWTDSGDDDGHIIRGGSWRDTPRQVRLFSRRKRDSLFAGPEVGFRCIVPTIPTPSPNCSELE
jgi:formylglycine-generating enzyme required for sulfatase activity